MIFAPQIRKSILQVLDEYIIPALSTQTPVQVLAQAPFDFSEVQNWPVSEQYLPDQKFVSSQYVSYWLEEGMVTHRTEYLGFVYEGTVDERIGLTQAQAQALREKGTPLPAGITAFRMHAPAVIAIPDNVAHSSGHIRSDEMDVPGGRSFSILWIHLMADGVLPHLASTINPELGSHLLHVPDRALAQMSRIYFEELRHARQDKYASAQYLLLSFMCRLRRYLADNRTELSNSAWEVLNPQYTSLTSQNNGRNQKVCRQIIDHIEMHLHCQLTLEILAKVANVSVPHLSRVFRQTTGMSLMNYVTQRRIEAAKAILFYQPERITDLARLVGFASASSFCAVFKRYTGHSPREFARHYRDNSHFGPDDQKST